MVILHLNGGFVIQDGHVYRIPHIPDPPLQQLRMASELWRAAQHDGNGFGTKESELAATLAASASEAVLAGGVVIVEGHPERKVQLADKSLAFFDEDGGVFCGTTGKPIPFPPRRGPGFAG